MRDRTVTVFGGAGFIGRYVVRQLAVRRATVRVPTRNRDGALFLRPMGDVGQVVPVAWQPHDDASLARVVAGSTDVVNLIGILHERRKGDFEAVQGRLPGRIGEAAKAAGAHRLVQISAIGADPASPSAYGRTKAEGEAAARVAFPSAVVLRPSIVFGPEDKFFNRFAAMARLSPVLPLIGGGHTRFQPVHVDDVAAAVVAALSDPSHAGQTFELGGPSVYTFADLMRYMLKVLGRRRLLVNLPFGVARVQGRILQLLPEPLLTVDQVEMLKRDNVAAPGAKTLTDLGIAPTPLEAVVPLYLRRHGRLVNRPPIA